MARTIIGTVVSDKNDKTIVISVSERKTHPLYKKQYTRDTKFMAHDTKNQAKVGDRVEIIECRPMSARKRFELQKVLQRGGVRFQEADATADIPEEQPAAENEERRTKNEEKKTPAKEPAK